jgi:uncharacterized membrane protein
MFGLALAGLAIALYLAYVKLAGELPACAVMGGCDRVNTSIYSELFGIPVAAFGAAASGLLVAATAGWWLRRSRSALMAAYVLGLASLPVLAYLTYLELFVIHAVCIWCVAYALTLVGGWIIASGAVWRSNRAHPNEQGEPI